MTHDMLIHIAVFGECGSGKTSLIRRYTRNDFDDKYAPSLVDFMTKKLLFDGKPLTLGIWEIPPPYEATSGVTNRYQLADRKDGIVFVYDMTDRKSLEKLQRIMEGLKPYLEVNENLVQMVIGTKLDMAADVDKVVAEAHEQLFGAQFIFATVSSKTAEGVEEAFDKLIRHTIESRGPKLRPGSDLGGHLSPDSEGNLRHRLACCSLGLPKWLKKLNGHQ